jgi:hypothetical protein
MILSDGRQHDRGENPTEAFLPPVDQDRLPAGLIERLISDIADRLVALLRFMVPIIGGQISPNHPVSRFASASRALVLPRVQAAQRSGRLTSPQGEGQCRATALDKRCGPDRPSWRNRPRTRTGVSSSNMATSSRWPRTSDGFGRVASRKLDAHSGRSARPIKNPGRAGSPGPAGNECLRGSGYRPGAR